MAHRGLAFALVAALDLARGATAITVGHVAVVALLAGVHVAVPAVGGAMRSAAGRVGGVFVAVRGTVTLAASSELGAGGSDIRVSGGAGELGVASGEREAGSGR